MTAMEVVEKMKEDLDLEPVYYPVVEKYVPALLTDLEDRGVVFDVNSIIGFASHAIALIKRLETGERVKNLGDEVLSQLDEEPLNISREALKPLEQGYGVVLDHSELALVTIHVQTAIEKLRLGK